MREPDISSLLYKGVKAWKIDAAPLDLDQTATIEAWLVHGNFNPAWSYWQVAVITLKDIPGVPSAKKHYDEAEYEFQIVALQSPPKMHPDPDDVNTLWPLLPPDAVIQFHGISDGHARGIVKAAVSAIVMDGVSPDSDNRMWWVQMVNRTVEHIREGRHN
jgi:hypothetical protein